MNIYDFSVLKTDGSELDLSTLKGKVVLIFNSATDCGFTPQYRIFQSMYRKHKDDGLEILDFPCNQYANQAPGTSEEIFKFCSSRYGITFPQLAKTNVFGDEAIPLFKYLAENTKFEGFCGEKKEFMEGLAEQMDPDYKNNGKIKWNFTKFLIDREGNIVKRYEVTDPMEEIVAEVEALL